MVNQEKIIGVYKIINIINLKYYIGYSINIDKRFKEHKKALENNKHLNILLQRSYNKYGIENFKFDIIHIYKTVYETKKKELEYLENIEIRNMLFNLNYNNSGGNILSSHPNKQNIIKKSETQKKKISLLSKDEKKLKYGRIGDKNGMYGKYQSKETKEKISLVNKGNSYAKGYKHTVETKKKLSDLAKTKIKEKNPFYGKNHSDETKRKLSLIHIGKIPTNATPITINNIKYDSLADAARKLNLNSSVILWRIKSNNPKFIDYKYTNEKEIKKPIIHITDI